MSVSIHDVRHALNELGKLRFGEMRVEDAMHHIVQTTHTIFSVDGAGLMLADVDHHLLNAAVSDDRMRHLEELQVRHQEGPCIAAFEDKELVRAEDLSQDDRWPSFSQHAVARGVRAVLASPIPYNQDAVGVVAVLSEDRRPWLAEAELALLAFTDLAAQLQSALNSRAIIEQAKGVLIGRQGLTAHAAYAQLRAQARTERRKLAIVSADVVRNAIRVDHEAVRENWRGIMYVIIGWIAVEVAFNHSRQQADRTGALHAISATPVGEIPLWLLVVGFIGMALWRLAEAAYGSPGSSGQKASHRVLALAKAVLYAVIAYGVLKYTLGAGSPQSSDKQSVDLTATLMRYPGGRLLVIVIGLAVIGAGVYLAYQAWHKEFLRDLQLGQVRARTRRIVEWLGEFGGIARGTVFVTAGIFLVVAAAEAKPQRAKGIDSALRALAGTPLGPWLLVLVAIGLIMFGVFSCCEAKWMRL